MTRQLACSLLALVPALGLCGAAAAKPARCFTTDDGYYPCEFQGLDGAGSFSIEAPGRPRFTLIVEEPGFASGFADFGGRNVPLPGRYVRDGADGACWNNPETTTRICAY